MAAPDEFWPKAEWLVRSAMGERRTYHPRLARTVHLALYAVLIAEGVAGAFASYMWWPASALHLAVFKVLLVLLTVHVAAALWHSLVRCDTALARLKPPFGWPRW